MQKHSSIPPIKLWSLAIVLSLSATLTFAVDPGKNGRIAFFANLTGTNQIFTVKADGSDLFQLTNLPPSNDGFALAPDFSPDGQRIVFAHDMTGALELYVINADGTGLMQITHDGLFHAVPRWSPDGSHIVFATSGKYGLAVIATVAADGSDMKLLTTPVWESLGASYTPDGKHIVFSSQQGGFVSALWIMDADGEHQRRLTRPELEAGPPDVSPDGNQVVSLYASRHAQVTPEYFQDKHRRKRRDPSHFQRAHRYAARVFARREKDPLHERSSIAWLIRHFHDGCKRLSQKANYCGWPRTELGGAISAVTVANRLSRYITKAVKAIKTRRAGSVRETLSNVAAERSLGRICAKFNALTIRSYPLRLRTLSKKCGS